MKEKNKKRGVRPLVVGATSAVVAAVATVGVMSSVVVPAYMEVEAQENVQQNAQENAQQIDSETVGVQTPDESVVEAVTEDASTSETEEQFASSDEISELEAALMAEDETEAHDTESDGTEPDVSTDEYDETGALVYGVEDAYEAEQVASKAVGNKSASSETSELQEVVKSVATSDSGVSYVYTASDTATKLADESDNLGFFQKVYVKAKVKKLKKLIETTTELMKTEIEEYSSSNAKAIEKMEKKIKRYKDAISNLNDQLTSAAAKVNELEGRSTELETALLECAESSKEVLDTAELKNEIIAVVDARYSISDEELASLKALADSGLELTKEDVQRLNYMLSEARALADEAAYATAGQNAAQSGAGTESQTGTQSGAGAEAQTSTTQTSAVEDFASASDLEKLKIMLSDYSVKLESTFSALKANITEINTKLTQLENAQKTVNDSVENLKIAASTQQKTIDGLKTETSEQQKDLDSLKSGAASQLENIEALRNLTASQREMLESLLEKTNGLSEGASTQQSLIDGLSEGTSETRGQMESLSGASEEQQKQIDSLSGTSGEQQKQIDSLSGTSSEQQKLIDSLSETSAAQQQSIEMLETLINSRLGDCTIYYDETDQNFYITYGGADSVTKKLL